MAFEEQLDSISREASADLSAKQYHFMVINSSGQLATVGAGLAIDGVLQNKPDAAAQAGTLGIRGVTKVVAGEAIAAGDQIVPDAAGKGVVASTTGDVGAGRALEAASGSGFVFAMLLNPQLEPFA